MLSVYNIGIKLEFIPAGYTAVLQPIDKGVNKPFKDYFKEHQLQWIINHQQGARPTCPDIIQWIQAAWDGITVETVTNTFTGWGPAKIRINAHLYFYTRLYENINLT